MNHQQSFIGFCGYEKYLATLKELAQTSNIRSGKSDYFYWGVIGTESIQKNTIAALSVGGFQESADAWVKVTEQGLILGREPFGRAPLYWLQKENVIWFASHFQNLLPLLNNPIIREEGLYGYCCFSYVPTPYTPVEEIYAVEAGKELIWDQKTFTRTEKERQHFTSAENVIYDETQAISQLESYLKDALHKQIQDIKNEPVGVCLSGGLDSSIIATLLVKAGLNVRAYSLDFPAVEVSEISYAEKLANYLKIPLTKIPITPKAVKKAIPATVKALDIPFGDSVTVPLYLLYQKAKEEVSVLFNGEHGDQLFAGWTNKPILTSTIYQTEHPNRDFTADYLQTFHRLYGYEKQAFSASFREKINLNQPRQWLQKAVASEYTTDIFDRFRRASLMLKGAQNIQPRATNLALAQGLSLRSPFCDLPLTQWTFQLSGDLILRDSCEKYILKRTVENWLPPEIVWRDKRGMGVPLTQWFFQDLWSPLRKYLSPNVLREEGFFDPELPLKLIKGELGGISWGRRKGEILWLLLIWEVWRDRVLGKTVNVNNWLTPYWLPPQVLKAIDQEES